MNEEAIRQLVRSINDDSDFKRDMKTWLETGKANTGSVMYNIKSIIDHTMRQKDITVLFSEADVGPNGREADMAVEYEGETYDIAIRRRGAR